MARPMSERTLAINSILDETAGNVTFAQVEERLTKAGLDVDSSVFNNVKSQWKRKHEDEPILPTTKKSNKNKPTSEVSVEEAVKFVTECGGLTNATNKVAHLTALVEKVKALSALMA